MNVLFRYPGFYLTDGMRYFMGHPAKWCWWCIYDILCELGHEVTPLDWNNTEWVPDRVYDAVFSIQHLDGLEGAIGPDTIKIIRTTASHHHHHNGMVRRRYAATMGRRGVVLELRRLLEKHDGLELADHILVNGNGETMRTYPVKYQREMVTMDTCASNLPDGVALRDYVPDERAFLFHAGSGAVHKGLDLVLEAFARHQDWTLHVTSNLRAEQDFLFEFQKELALPNIHYHGWTVVASAAFQQILSRCFAFILPTCSEGQSPAVATCLSLGLYPIISQYTGIDLPEGCGKVLYGLTTQAVEDAILTLPGDDELLRQVAIMQSDALKRYSRERFRETMTGYLKEWLK